MRIREAEEHLLQLQIRKSIESPYLVLFKEVGKEFLCIASQDANVLVSLWIAIFNALRSQCRDLLVYKLGDLDSYLHSQYKIFRKQWGKSDHKSTESATDICNSNFLIALREKHRIVR